MSNLLYPAKLVKHGDEVTVPHWQWNHLVEISRRLLKDTILMRDWLRDGFDGGATVPDNRDYESVLWDADDLAATLAAIHSDRPRATTSPSFAGLVY